MLNATGEWIMNSGMNIAAGVPETSENLAGCVFVLSAQTRVRH